MPLSTYSLVYLLIRSKAATILMMLLVLDTFWWIAMIAEHFHGRIRIPIRIYQLFEGVVFAHY
jgi:hypothetical protein